MFHYSTTKKAEYEPLGESRSLAVRRFFCSEPSLWCKNQVEDFKSVIQECFSMGHTKPVSVADLEKPREDVFYLPMHAVVKRWSITTKVCTIFDALARSSSGVLLNDQLLFVAMVHSALVDVVLQFCLHSVALTSYVSRMYWAILLPPYDSDLHRFVWGEQPDKALC